MPGVHREECYGPGMATMLLLLLACGAVGSAPSAPVAPAAPAATGAGTAPGPELERPLSEAHAFCAWASAELGRPVRLPTEAEWVALAGDIPPAAELHLSANGADPETFAAVVAGDEAYPQDDRLAGADGFLGTAPVGSLRPNARGLHDVWGNLTEWTSTPHGDRDVVHRGGAWNNGPRLMREPNFCGRHHHCDSTGFRVVVERSG